MVVLTGMCGLEKILDTPSALNENHYFDILLRAIQNNVLS